jgi:hypothetical protein
VHLSSCVFCVELFRAATHTELVYVADTRFIFLNRVSIITNFILPNQSTFLYKLHTIKNNGMYWRPQINAWCSTYRKVPDYYLFNIVPLPIEFSLGIKSELLGHNFASASLDYIQDSFIRCTSSA